MEDAKEFVTSVLRTLRERFGNPLISAFAVAWLVWNFRVVLVLIGNGDGGWLAKIDYLDKRLMVTPQIWVVHGFLIPLCFALVWIFVLPIVLRKVAVFHQRQMNSTRSELLIASEESPISNSERVELWAKFHQDRKSWNTEREEMLKIIDSLQEANETQKIQEYPVKVDEEVSGSRSLEISDEGPKGNLFHQNLFDRASAISVDLKRNSTDSDLDAASVTFDGRVVHWPWLVPNRKLLYGLSLDVAMNVENRVFSEFDIRVLHAVREPKGILNALEGDRNLEDTDLVFQLQSAIDSLRDAQLLERSRSAEYQLSTKGRMFLAWLLRVGFKIKEFPPV